MLKNVSISQIMREYFDVQDHHSIIELQTLNINKVKEKWTHKFIAVYQQIWIKHHYPHHENNVFTIITSKDEYSSIWYICTRKHIGKHLFIFETHLPTSCRKFNKVISSDQTKLQKAMILISHVNFQQVIYHIQVTYLSEKIQRMICSEGALCRVIVEVS